MVYVPDGLTLEEWKAIQAKEKAAQKNLGKMGTTKFKSRSFQAWHEAGGNHLFPVDPKLVKEGKVKLSEVPYMQRGGSWDDQDLVGKEKGVKKQAWLATDDKYSKGGERSNQSFNIFGRGGNLPWQGQNPYKDAAALDPVAEQKKWKRGVTNLPPNKAALERVQREREALAKKQAADQKKLEAQIAKEGGKRGWFW